MCPSSKHYMKMWKELGKQVIKWNHRLPDFNDATDEDGDKVPTAIEVQEELTDLTNVLLHEVP